jgi:meso-butanediol dehydrogenase/(S,S)-butanediol dehydrogenase/diacetyl reductase
VSRQVALVTGAGAGIGAAVCARLSAAGAMVIATDIDGDRAAITAADAGNREARFARRLDVSDPDQVKDTVRAAIADFGHIDILVNNAGIAPVSSLESLSLDAWRRVFAVNVDGPMMLTSAVAATMRKQGPSKETHCRGKIVNISSPAAEIGRPLLPAYGASKAALNHLSKSAAASWGDQGISTTIVYPDSVKDAMWPGLATQIAEAEGRTPEEVLAERIAGSPAGRLQEPDEVAAAVLFVAGYRGIGLNGRIVWSSTHVGPA